MRIPFNVPSAAFGLLASVLTFTRSLPPPVRMLVFATMDSTFIVLPPAPRFTFKYFSPE